jgi:hypothetical protein
MLEVKIISYSQEGREELSNIKIKNTGCHKMRPYWGNYKVKVSGNNDNKYEFEIKDFDRAQGMFILLELALKKFRDEHDKKMIFKLAEGFNEKSKL